MSQKWNLQDIRPAGQTRPKRSAKQVTRPKQNDTHSSKSSEQTTDPELHNITIEDGRKRESSRLWLAGLLFVVIVGGAALLSGTLGKTELTIYPEFRDPNISAEFTITPDSATDGLGYEVMTLERTSEAQVEASGKVQIEEQAVGTIEISKSTPGAERLIAQTRFRTADGLVFRIQESVVVPGAIVGEDGALMPGSIQARVFADDVGPQYNLTAGSEFDVPGFEEGGFTALFNAISATNPQPFTGGFSGPQFQIDDSELSTARQALQIELRNELLELVETSKPAGSIAFPGSVAITYNQLPAVEYGNDLVTIKEQATLQIPLFRDIELGSFIAQETVATYDGGPVRIEDASLLSFSYSSATTSSSVIANQPDITFTLTGKPRLIWEYDAEKLTEDLAGLPRTAIKNAIGAYPGIVGAKAEITPFWKRSFPEDPEDIVIIEELQEQG